MKAPIIALGTALVLSACATSLPVGAPGTNAAANLAGGGTGTVATRSLLADPAQQTPRPGLFEGLFTNRAADDTQAAQTPPLDGDDTAGDDTAGDDAGEVGTAQTAAASDAPRRTGFLAGLFGGAGQTSDSENVQTASLGTPQATTKAPPRNGPDARDVALGTLLPFGEIARVCAAGRGDLGTRIEQAGQGRARFELHDSNPASTAPRTFYVTGFSDGCPRQFTAALALFGDPAMHETLRYGLPSEKYPYSTTDKAYEQVKASICGVPRRKPCGSRIDALSRNTVFISTYERFTDNGRWADILLHDGTVLAAALKDL